MFQSVSSDHESSGAGPGTAADIEGLTVHGGNRSPTQPGLVYLGQPSGRSRGVEGEARSLPVRVWKSRCKGQGSPQPWGQIVPMNSARRQIEKIVRSLGDFDTIITHVLIAGGVSPARVESNRP